MTTAVAANSSGADDAGGDAKKWSLGKYYWVSVVHALRSGFKPPRLEFCIDSVRTYVLRIDPDDSRQFLLVDYGDQEALHDADGAILDLDALESAGTALPRSRRLAGQVFPLIVEDDETAAGAANVFAREVEGSPHGVAEAYEWVRKCFDEEYPAANAIVSSPETPVRPTLNAVVTRWNEENQDEEVDRRYVDLSAHGLQTLHARGTPHPTTMRYAACGRTAILCVRTVKAAVSKRFCAPLPVHDSSPGDASEPPTCPEKVHTPALEAQ